MIYWKILLKHNRGCLLQRKYFFFKCVLLKFNMLCTQNTSPLKSEIFMVTFTLGIWLLLHPSKIHGNTGVRFMMWVLNSRDLFLLCSSQPQQQGTGLHFSGTEVTHTTRSKSSNSSLSIRQIISHLPGPRGALCVLHGGSEDNCKAIVAEKRKIEHLLLLCGWPACRRMSSYCTEPKCFGDILEENSESLKRVKVTLIWAAPGMVTAPY
jgi:hypothetical protein